MQNKSPRSPWLILWIALFSSVAAALNQFKVPPIMPLLMDAFHLDAGRAGLLMSCFAITGLLLALPVGFILQRLGARKTGLLAIAFVVLGAAAGALSTTAAMMFASRFIEGAGMSFISIVSPALVAVWFSENQRGKAMGILAAWVPLGSTLMFLLAPLLASWWGWQGVWWFGCVFALTAGALYYGFIRSTPANQTEATEESLTKEDFAKAFGNRNVWLIGLLFCCFNFVFLAFVTWAPTFLNQIQKRSLANASFVISLITFFAILSSPLAGWVSDKMGSRKWICVVPMILLALLFPLASKLASAFFPPYVIALGLIAGFVPTGVFSAGVEVLGDKRLSGMAMAIILTGQYAGMLLGPYVFGAIVGSAAAWHTAFLILAPVSILGAAAGLLAKMN